MEAAHEERKCTAQSENDDRWIPSVCSICYGSCSTLVHRQNGVVTKIEGNPNAATGMGRLCAKGTSGINVLYDPNRLNVPIKRTNPEKGIGVDPGWQEITWAEALEIVAEKLRAAREKDPRSLYFQGTTTCQPQLRMGLLFASAFGTLNTSSAGGGMHCGNGAHVLAGLMHASWSIAPDFDYCNYAIYFGASKGHGAGHCATSVAQKVADARARGMKMVVIDPMCGSTAGKATEWVPIRVGTDAALALAMINVLLNELGIWDAEHIKKRTNGPYLVRPNGHYARDSQTGKPLIWDPMDGKAKVYDDASILDFALEGVYNVDGEECRTGFQLLKDHVRKYSPEYASTITTIAPPTIRRLALEFGEAARIGSTIVIDGVELPYRPSCAVFFRGAQGHKNSLYNCLSISLLNQVIGAADVPGGVLGFNPVSFGHPDTGRPRYVPKEGPDGLLMAGTWVGAHKPYPPGRASVPKRLGISEIFPLGRGSPVVASSDQVALWEKFQLPYRPEIMINFGTNSVMSIGNSQTVIEALRRIPFIVSFDIMLTEFSDFADIILPDTSYLERYDPLPNDPPILHHAPGMGEWSWCLMQPAVEPVGERRTFAAIMLELADRIGMREDYNAVINVSLNLTHPYALEGERKYTWEEIGDCVLKNNFGPERGLEWFKEHGCIKWPKKVEEVYWRPFIKVRVPLYPEFMKTAGESAKIVGEQFDFPIALSRYEPLPEWTPCLSHLEKSPDYDLWGFYYRDILHTNSFTMENPWLDEGAQMNPYTYAVSINAEVGRKKGFKDGEAVWVESVKGRKIKGRVKLTEGMHPEGLGIAACAGHWTHHQPIAKGKGSFFNELLEIDLDHADPVNMNMDLCVKVKIYKAT